MSEVNQLSGGGITLGPGTLYRTLQRMRVDGLIEEIDADPVAVRADRRAERRRSYRVTPAGRAAARTEARRLAVLLASGPARALLLPDQEQ
jgi:DNA-binding PadR family transcriptional regulator